MATNANGRWPKMPGSQKVLVDGVEMSTRPTSLWCLIPGLGPLVMFRLGASTSFRIDFKVDSEDVEERVGDGSLDLRLLVQGDMRTREQLSYPYPQRERNTFVSTEDFFLNGLGHSQLTIHSATAYTFDIWEPAYAIVNWGTVLLAGGLGGLIGFLLALVRDR